MLLRTWLQGLRDALALVLGVKWRCPVVLCTWFLTMEFLLGGRTKVLPGMSEALADLAAGAARCAGSDEMVLPRVVLCIRFWTMEFLLGGRTMVLPGRSDALALG